MLMDKQTRKILFVACLLSFLILCPIILAYSIGYYYDFNNQKIIPTGSILLKSIPAKSSIYLDNTLLEQTTPTYINNLESGNYSIKIRKNGFTSWEKAITVKNHQLSIAENILLLPTDSYTEMLSNNIEQVSFSPSKKNAIALTFKEKSNFQILKLANLSINEIPIVSSVDNTYNLTEIDTKSIRWSLSEKNISFLADFSDSKNDQKGYFVISNFSKETSELILLAETTDIERPASEWHNEHDDIFAYCDSKTGNLFLINMTTDSKSELALDANNFSIIGNKIYFIHRQTGILYYILDPWLIPFQNFAPESKRQFSETAIPEFSEDKEYELFYLNNDIFFIKDSSNKLFLAKDGKIEIIQNDNLNFEISPSKKDILISDTEKIEIFKIADLGVEDIKDTEQKPIQIDDKTKKAAWLNGHHIAYLSESGEFYVVELDHRNGRNTITPFEYKIEDFWIEHDTKEDYPILYYLKEGAICRVDWNKELET